MPRPCKHRRICSMPGWESFGPPHSKSGRPPVAMTLDEFEAIRLIDLEGLTQEQCAALMDVSRTTAQSIYAGARRKLADCLVHGRELRISGGDYVLCDGGAGGCGCPHGRCCRKNQQ